MIYQEQVMQIAQELAGYSLGSADLLRRAMGKKIKEEMDKQRETLRRRAPTLAASPKPRRRKSSSWLRSSPAMALTNHMPPPTRWSPTRPPT